MNNTNEDNERKRHLKYVKNNFRQISNNAKLQEKL